jgi:hypothetical protein
MLSRFVSRCYPDLAMLLELSLGLISLSYRMEIIFSTLEDVCENKNEIAYQIN